MIGLLRKELPLAMNNLLICISTLSFICVESAPSSFWNDVAGCENLAMQIGQFFQWLAYVSIYMCIMNTVGGYKNSPYKPVKM